MSFLADDNGNIFNHFQAYVCSTDKNSMEQHCYKSITFQDHPIYNQAVKSGRDYYEIW